MLTSCFAQLPDDFQEYYRSVYGKSASHDVLTHLRREIMHAIISLLFDEAFLDAYREGFLFLCMDDVTRRFFPRFFTHSADYVEK